VRPLSLGQRLARGWDALLELMSTSGQGASSFKGAEVSRLRPWGAGNRAADQEILWDLTLLRARARELRRNNPYVEQYVSLLLTNVLGPPAPDHQAQVRDGRGDLDEATNDVIEEAWRDWSEGPVTADGKMDLAAFRDLQLETAAIEGESFTTPLIGGEYRHGLALDSIDPDLVDEKMSRAAGRDGPEVRLGIEVDARGRPLGYHVWDRPEYAPGSRNRGRIRYDAADVLHHYHPRRAHQSRGVPWICSAIIDLMDLDGFEEAVIVGARAGANQLGFIEWADPSSGGGPSDDRKPVEMELAPGTARELEPGQKFSGFTPEQPTAVYSPFVKNRLRRIAGGTGVAYESLANDRESVNYSSMRGGAQIERDLWRRRQAWWKWTFELPIHRRWLETALLSGALQLPSMDSRRFQAVKIVFRGWPWVDPKNDAETSEREIGLGLNSRTRILAQRGAVYAEVLEELAQEGAAAREKGVDVEPRPAGAPATSSEPDDGAGDGDQGAAGSGEAANNGGAKRNRVRAALAR
jgi:lambda family phage portal protein